MDSDNDKSLATLFEVAATNVLTRRQRAGGRYRNDFLRAFLPVKRALDFMRDPAAYYEEQARDERLREMLSRPAPERPARHPRFNPIIFGNVC